MSWFFNFNLTPVLPSYTGPYKVGSVDVEIPATELDSPSPPPDSALPTVAFRIFYPCEPGSHERPVRWIPSPQRGYMRAYARFLGANSAFSDIFALLPQLLYYVTIPVHRNARILEAPTKTKRWPVMVFSHGLGGSRNAYSHLLGSLASHEIVVIAPDHRDRSSPITYIRATEETEAQVLEYSTYPHKPSPEVYEGRDEQFRIRLWELGLIHDALLKIDTGIPVKNLDPNHNTKSRKLERNEILSMFRDQLEVHQSGAIIWGGHSFGAATMVQLLKYTFYRISPGEKADCMPLFTPAASSNIAQQITPTSTVVLLDLWYLPLQSPSTRWLRNKPMPCYTTSGPGGTVLLAIVSEECSKSRTHLQETKRILSETPSSDKAVRTRPAARFFYPTASAHLSQSDFGILFPWVTMQVFGAKDPERVLRLNVRAILQMLRENGFEVADTSRIDMEEQMAKADAEVATSGKTQDWRIMDTKPGAVKGWVALSPDPDAAGDAEKVAKAPSNAVFEGEALGEMMQEEMT
ncbi:platelet-activating factor acetylhydrolase [Lepidopterella palustris CBS 459.81]|uniref:Putative phospholipase n=1 Tax=Lepidopterella palustris CBS 459.81 TaxID=1314670 RepID=A0A8E2EKP0_9PEZI|nr:platelet-activating factor acetylhydrolase [Lepidopterella palustris CBS 459.81]